MTQPQLPLPEERSYDAEPPVVRLPSEAKRPRRSKELAYPTQPGR